VPKLPDGFWSNEGDKTATVCLFFAG